MQKPSKQNKVGKDQQYKHVRLNDKKLLQNMEIKIHFTRSRICTRSKNNVSRKRYDLFSKKKHKYQVKDLYNIQKKKKNIRKKLKNSEYKILNIKKEGTLYKKKQKYAKVYKTNQRISKIIKYWTHQQKLRLHQNLRQRLINKKICEICGQRLMDSSSCYLLCTICDDAYHKKCLPQNFVKVCKRQWKCSECIKMQKNVLQQNQQYQQLLVKQQQSLLIQQQILSNQAQSTKLKSQINQDNLQQIKQISIPSKNFLQYTQKINNIIFNQINYCKLQNLQQSQQYTRKQLQCLGLKSFKPIKQQYLYWIPLLTTLRQTNLIYSSKQIYKNYKIMQLNISKNNIPQIVQSLHIRDQKQFQKFINFVDNSYAPPITVQYRQEYGNVIKALCDIQSHTILCQYGGEVMTARQSLQILGNDSIFRLLETGKSKYTLDIVPNRFANISKYFAGINNTQQNSHLKQNVQSMKFSYKGRNRIVFFTKRFIQKGELLFIDYNGGSSGQYPTDNFK